MRKKVIPFLVSVVLAYVLYPDGSWLVGNIIGKVEAQIDLQKQQRFYRRCQRNCVWTELTEEFERIMEKEYQIKVVPIEGCTSWGFLRGRTDGYNNLMEREFDKAIHPNLIDVTQTKAFDEFQARYKRPQK